MRSLRTCWQNNHFLIGTAFVTVVIAGCGAVLWLGNFDEKRRFAAVEPGMTEEEVLTILGKPPGQYGPAGAKYGRAMWEG